MEIINLEDVDIYLDECQLAVTEVDENVDVFFEDKEKYNILQVDGLEEEGDCKKYFSVNCKIEELVVLINFFCCFKNLWNSSIEHPPCMCKPQLPRGDELPRGESRSSWEGNLLETRDYLVV